jgi:hypothetical protein
MVGHNPEENDNMAFLWGLGISSKKFRVLKNPSAYYESIGILEAGTVLKISHFTKVKGCVFWIMGECYNYELPYATVLNGGLSGTEVNLFEVSYPINAFLKPYWKHNTQEIP